eukprot:scaffold130700_cov57-Phaeocystis_antarctica.AAC.3
MKIPNLTSSSRDFVPPPRARLLRSCVHLDVSHHVELACAAAAARGRPVRPGDPLGPTHGGAPNFGARCRRCCRRHGGPL